ncbi:MAG: nicotinate (nicotinamide) nucleotide adenylyltransferase [Tenericutes bacterium]|jgi:nicotinate-nucleotide adenylyltransferase|nr:nicotinate (nicotinamide) nucleotide adenylyltransferase [Mycoplasmatota bacterium]
MIVVFGGAFNPPTLAHKDIYHLIDETIKLDKFLFLPVSKKYSKSTLINDDYRVEMLKILIKDLEKASISKIETQDAKFLGTYQSLLRIKEEFPNQEIAFVLGADNLLHMNHWINVEKLLSDFKFIVVNRNNENVEEKIQMNPLLNKYKDHFIVLKNYQSNISSTLFRETLDPSYIDEEVYHYIMKNDLYRGNY